MKYFSLIVLFFVLSCGNKKDVLLPKSNVSIVKDITDLSPIYIFFETKGKDTLAEVNRKNEIISTNWIFNIDKRLPLRLVLPEVAKLQEKKRNEKAHKNELAQNYYSYADSIGKNLAFLPFTAVLYKMEQPKTSRRCFYFLKNGKVKFNDSKSIDFPKEKLQESLDNLVLESETEIFFSFDKNMSFGTYIQNKIFVEKIKSTKKGISFNRKLEYIY